MHFPTPFYLTPIFKTGAKAVSRQRRNKALENLVLSGDQTPRMRKFAAMHAQRRWRKVMNPAWIALGACIAEGIREMSERPSILRRIFESGYEEKVQTD